VLEGALRGTLAASDHFKPAAAIFFDNRFLS
jgi:hypothetical protein